MDRAETKDLLEYYKVKRKYTAIDEWLMYAVLIVLIFVWIFMPPQYADIRRNLLVVVVIFAILGAWLILTSYKNLGLVEDRLQLCPDQYMLYPF